MSNRDVDLVDRAVAEVLPDVVQTRHHLHQNPELSGCEKETSALVAAKLQSIGLDDVRTGVGGHGIIGELKGTAGPGRTIALRGDMDALPIQEESELPYRSCRPGVMHACGHDGHTSTLFGTAAVLTRLRDRIRGTVRFVFQPAEETVNGAASMCAGGAMDGVDAIVALHGWPGLEIGRIGVRPGPMMASTDTYDVTIRGRGAHAAMPHVGVDPIVTAAQVVLALQTVSSREIAPTEPVVVTVGQIHAGTAYNIIPGTAEIKGTVRCLSSELRASMPARLERVVAGVCAAMRADYVFRYDTGVGVVVNDAAVCGLVAGAAAEALGAENVVTLPTPSMGAEDFSVYLDHAPGMMFRLGVGADSPNLHTPHYNFPDEALPVGIGVFVRAVLRYLDSAAPA
jgi:amidohydrolase